MVTTSDRVSWIEAILGLIDDLGEGGQTMGECLTALRALIQDLKDRMDEDKIVIERLMTEVGTLKFVFVQAPTSSSTPHKGATKHVRIPEPATYACAKVAKELKNFIWDLK